MFSHSKYIKVILSPEARIHASKKRCLCTSCVRMFIGPKLQHDQQSKFNLTSWRFSLHLRVLFALESLPLIGAA